MRLKSFTSTFAILILIATVPAYAGHPLITDDAGTAGKNGLQAEFAGEYSHENEDGATEKTWDAAATFTYGIADSLDIVLGVPYLYIQDEAAGVETGENGFSDISLGVKWRFLEAGIFNFAVKPGISFPAGDEEKGLGTGKTGYSAFFISTIDLKPFAFHVNAGYIRNNNKADEEKNIRHGSLACEYKVNDSLKLVADIGIETNTDREVNENPEYILGGVVYSINEKVSLDAGIELGLNKPETDYSCLAGLTLSL